MPAVYAFTMQDGLGKTPAIPKHQLWYLALDGIAGI